MAPWEGCIKSWEAAGKLQLLMKGYCAVGKVCCENEVLREVVELRQADFLFGLAAHASLVGDKKHSLDIKNLLSGSGSGMGDVIMSYRTRRYLDT